MRILVLSDSHFVNLNINIKKYDYVIHCGDYGQSNMENIIYVKGNCDNYGEKEKIINIDNNKIFITHGDLYNVKFSMQRIYYKTLELGCNICLYGHTHIQKIDILDNMIFLNPGSYISNSYCEIIDNEIKMYDNNKLIKTVKIGE